MGKGKQGQARKKAPPPEDKDDKEEEVQDDEMQLQFSTKSQKTTKQPQALSTQAQQVLLQYHQLPKL